MTPNLDVVEELIDLRNVVVEVEPARNAGETLLPPKDKVFKFS